MTRHDAQRAEDARQKAEVEAKTWAATDRRILGQWHGGERNLAAIGRTCGVSKTHVRELLEREGLRPKQEKRTNRRTTTGAIIRKIKAAK